MRCLTLLEMHNLKTRPQSDLPSPAKFCSSKWRTKLTMEKKMFSKCYYCSLSSSATQFSQDKCFTIHSVHIAIGNAPAIEETSLYRMCLFRRFGFFLSKLTDASTDGVTEHHKNDYKVVMMLFCLYELKLTSKSSSSSCHLMDEIKCLEKSTNKAIKTNNHHITEINSCTTLLLLTDDDDDDDDDAYSLAYDLFVSNLKLLYPKIF
ncbi:hypothetical protein GQX74_014442 [Glossina fuscipes]|nr:hypothetical protein GQX74_014442 [Glossina fuscipes]